MPHFVQLRFPIHRNFSKIMSAAIATVSVENNVHDPLAYRAGYVPTPDYHAFSHNLYDTNKYKVAKVSRASRDFCIQILRSITKYRILKMLV